MTDTTGSLQITSVAGLLGSLELERVDDGRFRAHPVPMNMHHVFGGQVLGQGLVAAARTVEGPKTANSLHAYFLRAGDPDLPIEYAVGTVRDGRRMSTRSVSALQAGREIATVICSFADTEGTITHAAPRPEVAAPEDTPTLADNAEAWGGLHEVWSGFQAVEVRMAPSAQAPEGGGLPAAPDLIWMRVREALPDDDLLHRALLAYLSDITLLAAALVAHGVPIGMERRGSRLWDGVSLDHALWFHRPARTDSWTLFVQESPVAHGGRALSRASIYSHDGEFVASSAQEGLITDLRA
ncbi:MAG: acyl-CoA thioesterase II [Frankiales bacterium]|nr:acyl-CoA thioesterase II [Frankiales bacterium]